MPSSSSLRIEKHLALAHLALSRARDEAGDLNGLGLHDDLQMMLMEVERLSVSHLRGGIPHRLSLSYRAYLSSLAPDDGRSSA